MRQLSGRHIVLGALLVGSILFLLRSQGIRDAAPPGPGGEEQAQAEGAAPAAASELPPAAPWEVGFDRYAQLAKTNVFSQRRSQPPPSKPKPVLPEPPLPKDNDSTPPPKPKVDLVGWSYVGYVEAGGELLGILQNETTLSCKYLAVGDRFEGATVEEISRESLRLRSGASPVTLSRPRDFPVTPLEKVPGGEPRQPRRP
jgi:hypothetical protein